MSVQDLILQYSTINSLPVEVDNVVSSLRQMGVQDEIYYFWDRELPTTTLRGFLKREEIPFGSETKFHSTITYAVMGNDMERLVCCKELLHILDHEHCKTAVSDEVTALIKKIILPPDLADPFTDGSHVNADRIAIMHALAILFPLKARETLYPFYKHGKITIQKIAELAEIPEYYATFVMSDLWPMMHNIMVRKL